MAGLFHIILGAVEIVAGVVTANPLLIVAGAGQVITGISEEMQTGPIKGLATTERDSIGPWTVVYGQTRVGGHLAYNSTFGNNNQCLDLIISLACHPIESIDALLIDGQLIQIDQTAVPTSALAGYSIVPPQAGSGTSFTPTNNGNTPYNIASIVRSANGVVTVTLNTGFDIPLLEAGYDIKIQGVGNNTFNGTFTVTQIIARGTLIFTYLSGGTTGLFPITNSGQAITVWANYQRCIYMETQLGGQTLGTSFRGELAGVPWMGTGRLSTPASVADAGGTDAPNPWTSYCTGVGHSSVFLRFVYTGSSGQVVFTSGIPQVSFLIHGKNNIWNSTTSTYGYSNNASLCIADYLSYNPNNLAQWGYKFVMGTDIPTAPLIAAQAICDTHIPLVIGGGQFEAQYTCSGSFPLTQRRGEVLQNLLTSCAGRITTTGGLIVINPGAFTTPTVSLDLQAIARTGTFRWRGTAIKDLYNMVSGTYVAASNKYISTDYPSYAQDWDHGYGSGPGDDILLDADNGERRIMQVNQPFCTSSGQAQRVAKIYLLRSRFAGTGTFSLSMSAYQLAPLDIFLATSTRLGMSNQALEVQASRLVLEDSNGGVILGTEIDRQISDSSIYNWVTVEELSPAGYAIAHQLRGQYIAGSPFPWAPGTALITNGDATYPEGSIGPASFNIQPIYSFDAQGDSVINLQISGVPPISNLDQNISAPQVTAVGIGSGGSLPPGEYVVGVSAYDSGASTHGQCDYLNVEVVNVPGTGSGIIVLDIDDAAGDDGFEVYLGQFNTSYEYIFHLNQVLASGATGCTLTTWDQSTHGGCDGTFWFFGVQYQQCIHAGPWALSIISVTPTTITLGGVGMLLNQWAGYQVSLLARYNPTNTLPILNMAVASSTASSGGEFVLTIGPNVNSVSLPDLTTLLNPLDVILCQHHATFTSTSFSDVNIANGIYPTGATGTNAGDIAVMLTGANQGDQQVISSVTTDIHGNYTVFNLAGNWVVTPATGDIVVVCSPITQPVFQSAAFQARSAAIGPVVVASPIVSNLAGATWLVRVLTLDSNGDSNTSIALAPNRLIYLFGGQGTRTAFANTTQMTNDGMILCDSTAGSFTVQLLSVLVVPNMEIIIKKTSSDINTVTILPFSGEFIDGSSTSVVLVNDGDYWQAKANG